MPHSLKNRLKGILKDESNTEKLSQQIHSLSLGSSNVESADCGATEQPAAPQEHKISLPEELWNRAYDALKKDKPSLISAYQTLLSKVLHADLSKDVIADNAVVRREQMRQIIDNGLIKTEEEVAKKKSVTNALQIANQVKETIAAGLKPSPQATLVWTALTATLPLILNASEQSKKNREGIETVLLVLKQLDLLSGRTLFNHDAEDLRQRHTVRLYQNLLLFLIKSACYYHRNRLEVIFRDSVKIDDWDQQIKDIKDAEASLRSFLADFSSLSREDKECLAKLHITTPALDKESIEKRAGSLFRDCYKWILDHDAFQKWRDGNENLLWIKGDPGKGKTMLLCGIINQLANLPSLSYFFCQATYDKTNNNATAILRGLIWMLADQNPHLIQHIKKEADRSSNAIYTDSNSFYSLSKILRSMLQDIDEVIFIVDALDECGDGRNDFIDLVRETSKHIKWLMSSRNWSTIEERLGDTPKVSLEIEGSVTFAVQCYINLKVSQLAAQKAYSQELTTFILEYLSQHAQGTFLWCALVCTSLQNASKREARKMIKELPPTLDALYGRMLQSVNNSREVSTIGRLLAIATYVYRPISIGELSNVMEMSSEDLESIGELIQECGSFLTIRDDVIEFVHLSAQEYIKKHLQLAIEAKSTHKEIYCCSLRAMSRTLKRNIYELDDACIHLSVVVSPSNNLLASITYSCLFWTRHLEESGIIVDEMSGDSALSKFFQKDFLFWLEAMSLLDAIPQAVFAMHILHSVSKNLATCQLRDFILDARRFVLYSRTTLDVYPLQIYDSSLVFCPVDSLVRKAYISMAPKWVTMSVNPMLNWSSSITAFNIDNACVHSKYRNMPDPVYISNDDQIALVMDDGRILTYNLTTGSLDQTLDLARSFDMFANCSFKVRGLACHELDSSLLFIIQTRTETQREEQNEVEYCTISSVLGIWNLKSSQTEVLKVFPYDCKLSPYGRYITYEEEHDGKLSLSGYDTIHDQSFPLLSMNESVLDYIFAVDGTTIAIWWQSGSIEIYDFKKRSRLGIVEYQFPILGRRHGTLSQRGEILAISFYHLGSSPDFDDRVNEVKVFDVKTGQLLWSKTSPLRRGFENWEACTFLQNTLVLVVNCGESISSYDAFTGVCVDKIETLYGATVQPLHCKKQLALISYARVELLDMSMTTLTPSVSTVWYLVRDNQDKTFRTFVIDLMKDVAWHEARTFDTGDIVWKSPALEEQLYNQNRVATTDNYFIDRRRNMVAISHLNGSLLQEYSALDISHDVGMSFSPDGSHIVFWQQDFTSVYNIKERTLINDSTLSIMVPKYPHYGYYHHLYDEDGSEVDEDGSGMDEDGSGMDEDGSEVDEDGSEVDEDGSGMDEDGSEVDEDGSGMDEDGSGVDKDENGEHSLKTAPPYWTLEGERFVRQIDKGLLIWSRGKGFKKIALEVEDRGSILLSSCATWLACFMVDINGTTLSTPRNHIHKVQIWNVETKEVRSVLNLEVVKDSWEIIDCYSQMAFLPEKEQLLIVGNGLELWSFSNYSGQRLFYLPGYFSTRLIRFTSPTDLETAAGVISLSHSEIKLGTVNDPFSNRDWIYLDNCKALLVPRVYFHMYSAYSEAQLAFTTPMNKVAILHFSLNRICETEREVFRKTHKRAVFGDCDRKVSELK